MAMKTDFSPEEKMQLFDMIAAKYFDRNFGTMLKADMDTLIFSCYIEHCLKNDLPYDDYSLSIALGITESRVRALKERKQLQYPYKDYEWKKAFVALIPNSKYNPQKQLVQINIMDVNLLKDVRHFVYENGWFDEFQLNPRLFQCRLDYFLLMCHKLEQDNELVFDAETKKSLKELLKNDTQKSAIEKIISGDFENGLKELLKDVSDEVLSEVLKAIPFGGLAKKAIDSLLQIIIK